VDLAIGHPPAHPLNYSIFSYHKSFLSDPSVYRPLRDITFVEF
jgi:hypothetical protein